ncbi:hypothetical protein [Nitrosopumilus cobalaminigenes]|nr:hypothetical protein [Nitrosopumilus cobalaminigenes]
MQLQLAIVIGAIIVGGALTANLAFMDSSDTANSMKSTAGIMGHLTLTATNEDGEIIAYRQTDNVVINAGDDCLIDDTFGVTFSGCTNPDGAFTTVHIGDSQSGSPTETTTALGNIVTSTGGTVGSFVAAATDQGASVTVTADFLNVSASIDEAALMNGAANQDALAIQEFAAISLGENDDLTIEWTVTIDGS